MVVPPSAPVVRAWKPSVAGVREVLHARFTDHSYPLHTHDAWTLFIVDDGAIEYDLDRRSHHAAPSMVSVLPPFVVHDGRPATSGGYRKRVLYLEPGVLGEHLVGPAVDRPVIPVGGLRRRLSSLHDALSCADDVLEAETHLAFVSEAIRLSLGDRGMIDARSYEQRLADELRGFLDAHVFEPVTLAAAGLALGSGPTQLARSFSAAFGIPPHAYVLGRRLEAARDRILRGEPLADVAAGVGFYDQAHLTHHFRHYLGTTPGRFRDRTNG
jgi:AraC-like DNA-binding protein